MKDQALGRRGRSREKWEAREPRESFPCDRFLVEDEKGGYKVLLAPKT
jgi:hypothetical protein